MHNVLMKRRSLVHYVYLICRSSDNIADLKSIELGEIEVTEKQSLSSESSLIRPLSPIDWEAMGDSSRTEDRVRTVVTL